MNDTRPPQATMDADLSIHAGASPQLETALGESENPAPERVPPPSPRRRKISEDLQHTPSPHKAGVQRNICMPKPIKL
ncbi:unnamed protein product [Sphacelaria rigidula]